MRLIMKITSYIEKDPETGMYIATVPSIPGAHTQAKTLDDLQRNLQEVVILCLQEMDAEDKKLIPEFVGLSQLDVEVE